jgi:hypothetical protein
MRLKHKSCLGRVLWQTRSDVINFFHYPTRTATFVSDRFLVTDNVVKQIEDHSNLDNIVAGVMTTINNQCFIMSFNDFRVTQ